MLDKRNTATPATTAPANEIPAGMQGRILAAIKGKDGLQVAFAPEGSPLAFMVEGLQEGKVVAILTTVMGKKIVLPADAEIDGELKAVVKNLFTTTSNEVMFVGHGDMPIVTQLFSYSDGNITPFLLGDMEVISGIDIEDELTVLTRTSLFSTKRMASLFKLTDRGVVGQPVSLVHGPMGCVILNSHVPGKGYKAYAFDASVDTWPNTNIGEPTIETVLEAGYLPRPIAAFSEGTYVFENTYAVEDAPTYQETFLTVEQATKAGWFDGISADDQDDTDGGKVSGSTRTFGDNTDAAGDSGYVE